MLDDVAEGSDPVAEMFSRSAPEEPDDGHVADAAALPLAAVAGQSAGEPPQHVAQSAVRLRPHQKVNSVLDRGNGGRGVLFGGNVRGRSRIASCLILFYSNDSR